MRSMTKTKRHGELCGQLCTSTRNFLLFQGGREKSRGCPGIGGGPQVRANARLQSHRQVLWEMASTVKADAKAEGEIQLEFPYSQR